MTQLSGLVTAEASLSAKAFVSSSDPLHSTEAGADREAGWLLDCPLHTRAAHSSSGHFLLLLLTSSFPQADVLPDKTSS